MLPQNLRRAASNTSVSSVDSLEDFLSEVRVILGKYDNRSTDFITACSEPYLSSKLSHVYGCTLLNEHGKRAFGCFVNTLFYFKE